MISVVVIWSAQAGTLGEMRTTESPRTKSISDCFFMVWGDVLVACQPRRRRRRSYLDLSWCRILFLLIQVIQFVYCFRHVAENKVAVGVVGLLKSHVSLGSSGWYSASIAPEYAFSCILYLPSLGPHVLQLSSPQTFLDEIDVGTRESRFQVQRINWLTWSRPCNSLSPLNFTKTISSRQRRTRSRGSSGREVGDPGSDILNMAEICMDMYGRMRIARGGLRQ